MSSPCCSIPINSKKKLKEYSRSIKTWVNCLITYSLYRFVPLKLEIVVNTIFDKQAKAVFSLMSETLQLGLPVKLTCVLSFSVCRRATRWESWDTHEMAAYSLSLLQWIISLIQSSLWAVECQTTRLLWLNYKLNSRGHQTNCSLRLCSGKCYCTLHKMMAWINVSVRILRLSHLEFR